MQHVHMQVPKQPSILRTAGVGRTSGGDEHVSG
jgi:hypothetical protein